VKAVPEVSETRLIGGLRRQLRITLDRDRLAGFGVAPGSVLAALGEANRALRGELRAGQPRVPGGRRGFVATASDLGGLVIGVARGRPVYVRDVASVDDGPEEPREYVLMMGGGRGRALAAGRAMPAVTLSVAKRKGTNAS
jgi:multidrug efflux pump subunit AcrB